MQHARNLLRRQFGQLNPRDIRKYFRVYTDRGIIVSFIAIVVVGGATTIMQMRSINELKQLTNQQQVVASNVTLLNGILLATVDAETGQRGYLLSGNPTYLAPYDAALPQITTDFKKLKRLPQQPQDLAAINKLQKTVDQKLAELHSTLDAKNAGGISAATAIVQTNRGLALMDSIRSQVNTIENRQGDSLGQQRNRTLGQINSFRSVLVAVRISALLLVISGMYLIGKVLYQRYELERNKGEFIDIAAHQLRTPASITKIHLGALLGGYMGKLSSSQRSAIKSAFESNEHAIQIIEDVLKVAKIESGVTALRPQPERVQKILNDAITSLRPTLTMRKQKLVRHFPKQPVIAALDVVYIRMVIENLLDNASKYSRKGSTITLSLESTPQRAYIHVKDNGVGIARQDLQKLFKKFSRVENELSDSITGSGLGLFWAQQIAELHGGKITVKSKKGSGSEFTLELRRYNTRRPRG